jgi:hypothetical protein
MKTSKMSAGFIVLLMALAGIGAGYAMWTDMIQIDGTVETGDVCVGIRCDWVNDPEDPATADLNVDLAKWLEHNPAYGHDDLFITCPEGKNVGWVDCIDVGEVKCTHEGDDLFQIVDFYAHHTYPLYYFEVRFEIANCGSIPVKLLMIEYWDFNLEEWIPFDGSNWDIWHGVLHDDIWLGYYKVQLPAGEIEGFHDDDFFPDLMSISTQLEHCESAFVTLGWFLYEDEFSIPEQNEESHIRIRLTWAQWNEVY